MAVVEFLDPPDFYATGDGGQIDPNPPADEPTNYWGWGVKWVKDTWKKLPTVTKVATVAATATGLALTGYSIYTAIKGDFRNLTMIASSLFGAASIAALPASAANFFARWSLEGSQVLTEFFDNGGIPRKEYHLWDVENPPASIKYTALAAYFASAAAIVALRTRPIFFKRKNPAEEALLLEPTQQPNRLLIESTTELYVESTRKINGQFFVEQALKGVACASLLIWLLLIPQWSVPEMLDSALVIMGDIPASVAAGLLLNHERRIETLYNNIKTKVQEADRRNELEEQLERLARIRQVTDIVATIGLGIMTIIARPYGLIGLGACMGVKKILDLYRFEQLTRNPDKKGVGGVFSLGYDWFKGLLLVPAVAYYTYGLWHNPLADKISTALAFAGGIGAYFAQRKITASFTPRQGPRWLNSLAFYTGYFPIAIYPYTIRRATGRLANSSPNEGYFKLSIDWFVWTLWGGGWGSGRAQYGIQHAEPESETEEASPDDVLPQASCWSGEILGNGGKNLIV